MSQSPPCRIWYLFITVPLLGLSGPAPLVLGWNRNHMYIDPTTGSLVLQFLAAGVLSVLAMFARVREAIKSFFKMLIPRRRQ
jgi:hypothetical protein